MAEKLNGRRGIKSVEIGMRVLSAVSTLPGPSTLSSIAQQASLSLSQTHRYLASLIAAGMVGQDARSGLYDLDAGAIRVGLAALSRIDVFDSAELHLKQLVLETRRTCTLSVWGDAGPTVVRMFPGSPPVMVALSLGSHLPLLRSAIGQVFYTFGERVEMDRQARLIELSDPAGVPVDLIGLQDRIRAAGLASISGDLIHGLRAMAAPILDLQGNLVLVASLMAGSDFPESGDAAAAEALVRSCDRITESIGGRRSDEAISSDPEPPRKGRKLKTPTPA